MSMPSSLRDAIREDPKRFISYLDLDAIKNAKDQHAEFKHQLQKAFGNTTTGLNMWQHIRDNYQIQNQLFKNDKVQAVVREENTGAFKKKEYQRVKEKYNRKSRKPIDTTVRVAHKTERVETKYTRNIRGKQTEVSAYARTKPRTYSSDEMDFLNRRIGQRPSALARTFNQVFKTNRTLSSITTKMSRLRQ